jgi:hypothetical protein
MRLRSVVLPVVVACAAAVAVPTPAAAAPSQCSLVMPTKVVIDDDTVPTDIRLSSNCFTNGADHAYWDLLHPGSGWGGPLDFESADFASGDPDYYIEWYDDDPMGNWYLEPVEAAQADGDPLTQNSAVTKVKYASRLTTKVTRTSTRLTWAVTATQWSGRTHGWNTRAKVTVSLFHQATGSTTWRYVKSVTTTSTGKATMVMNSPKAGNYRLVVGETPTVWASYSSPIRGRI